MLLPYLLTYFPSSPFTLLYFTFPFFLSFIFPSFHFISSFPVRSHWYFFPCFFYPMSAAHQKVQIEAIDPEDLGSDEFSSESTSGPAAVYRPDGEPVELEMHDGAYTLHEYINIEWPAQSITVNRQTGCLYLGTNPAIENKEEQKQAESNRKHKSDRPAPKMELIEISLKSEDFKSPEYQDTTIDVFINRIRHNTRRLYAVSDTHLTSFKYAQSGQPGMTKDEQIQGEFGYGIAVDEKHVYVGTRDGTLLIYDALRLSTPPVCLPVHSGSIECICLSPEYIFTASTDKSVQMIDKATHRPIRHWEASSEVNAVDVSINGDLVYGDDDGLIYLVRGATRFPADRDGQTTGPAGPEAEHIKWHATPISFIRFRDGEVFASGSDEQVCLWDLTIDEDWEWEKYLLFVHQGQRYYKDVDFYGDLVVVTSQDGLCVFTPISFGHHEV